MFRSSKVACIVTPFERHCLPGSFRRSFKIFRDLGLVRDALNMCMGNDVPRSLPQDWVDSILL